MARHGREDTGEGWRGQYPGTQDPDRDRRRATDDVEETLDRVVSSIGTRAPEYSKKARVLFRETGVRLKELDNKGEEYSQRMFKSRPAEAVMETILRWRKTVFVLTIIASLMIGYYGMAGSGYLRETIAGNDPELAMNEKIRADFEVYLPGGSDAELVLMEMKTDWSTDLANVFVETNNKFDPTDETNITDVAVLKEISNLEDTLNPDKTDKGANDGVIYCFSIATLIKTMYQAPNAVYEAIANESRGIISGYLDPNIPGNYSIPDDQLLLDRLFYEIGPENLSSLVADINGDGIYDSALVLIGLSQEVDQRQLIADINERIEPYFVDPGVRPGSEDTTDQWMDRYERGEVHCRMTLTGPTPLARMISDRTMLEMRTILPWAIALVAASLLIFHRTWKIWPVTLIPVLFSLIIAYGMMGLFLPVLTPQVVLVAPIIIALGVAYGLYIANRYSEEEGVADKEKRIRMALRTTGKAIFLSAMTTAFGFGAMLTVDMATMKVLGFGLATGILACYVTTMLLTPSLIIWTNYRKIKGDEIVSRVKKSGKKRSRLGKIKLGDLPLRHSRKLLVGGILLAILSFALSPMSEIPGTGISVGGFSIVEANMDYMALSPDDEPVVQKMGEQSDTFNSGQIGLLLIRGEPSIDQDMDGRDDGIAGSMKDFEVLYNINLLMRDLNGAGEGDTGIDNVQAVSIVEIMKMIQIPDFTDTLFYQQLLEYLKLYPFEIIPGLEPPWKIFDNYIRENVIGKSFWHALQNVPDNELLDAALNEPADIFMVNVFYNSMGQEIRGMLINDDYSKTIVYLTMPNMDIIETKVAVNEVNGAIDYHYDMTAKEGADSASPLSGFGAVLVTINEVVLKNANQSTLMALVMVFLLLLVVFRSWRISLITMFPVIVVVFWQYFAIWMVGNTGEFIAPGESMFSGDLNLFTALIGSIVIGIGVDFAIHITERIREKNFSLDSVRYATETSGWSFIESTTTMVMGLTAVFLINIPSIREFILLIMILLVFSAYSAIFLLTSLYKLYLPRYNKMRRLKRKK